MRRLDPRQEVETSMPRRGRWSRLAPVLVLAGVAILLTGCGPAIDQPFTTITPQTDKADDIQNLYKITFWAALIVFVGVQVAIGYTALRFRRRGDERPEQVHGSRKLEIAWTVIPAVILLVLFIPTAQIIFKHAAAAEVEDAFRVDVLGKQWWWEISYPNIPADPNNAEAGPLTTANEVVLPVGANVVFSLHSNNVIHSFWVPQLSGKMDVVPGHQNLMQFIARTPGDYWGECAEFCGGSHAWMRFKVKILPQEDFDAWVEAWRSPPATDGNPETADVVEVPPAFGACLACHRVSGTNAQIAQQGVGSNPYGEGAGPNLTLFACRDSIGAGILKNTPENMETWLKHTNEVKEGVYMPNYYEQGMTDEQIAELVEYLGSLEPAGGCPDAGLPVGGGIAATPVAASAP
jgi:cytochrome c oxidase subunit 2